MSISKYHVTGMSCGHCERAISDEVTAMPGVERVEVSASSGTLTVHSSVPIDDSQVLTAVEKAGYRADRAG